MESALLKMRGLTPLTRSKYPPPLHFSLSLRMPPEPITLKEAAFKARPIPSKHSGSGESEDDEEASGDAFTGIDLTTDGNLLNIVYQQQMKKGNKSDGGDPAPVKEDGEALYLRMDMPGLGKEDVKVRYANNLVCIKGESSGEEKKYSEEVFVWSGGFKVKEIKAEMKNGVLKVVIPKMKAEDREDFVEVNVD